MKTLRLDESGKKVVIIGGGFAGLNLALKLSHDKYFDITLIDKNNYNFFPPLIYQVASSFLDPSSISYPFRKLFRKRSNLHFRAGALEKISPISHTFHLEDGEISYDYLVIATGAVSNYFGIENIARNAIPIKTLNDALLMRNRLLQTLEKASITKDVSEREKMLTIVVAGGGPTGVEVAGVLAELRKSVLAKDYPELRNQYAEIYLVEGGANLLGQMSAKSQQEAYQVLTRLGVRIILNTSVRDFYNDKVMLSNGKIIITKSLVWAAGIIGGNFEGIPLSSIAQGKRILTDAYNKILGLDDVYAIGDICIQKTDLAYPAGHPQLAQIAIQQGVTLARNFTAMSRGNALKPFSYFDKGTMAILGRNNAVTDFFKSRIHVSGIPALIIWLFIHLMSLVSYRNRFSTLWNWVFAYFTRDQSLRMIFRPDTGVYSVTKEKPPYEHA